MLLLGCRKYVAKNTLACQVFSRYRRKMLPKYAEKHLVTNRAAIPFIYLGACATPSNTRTNTQRRERREREEQQDTNNKDQHQNCKGIQNKSKSSYDASGTVDVGSEEAAAGDGHQRPLHNVIHNVIHGTVRWVPVKSYMVMEPQV